MLLMSIIYGIILIEPVLYIFARHQGMKKATVWKLIVPFAWLF